MNTQEFYEHTLQNLSNLREQAPLGGLLELVIGSDYRDITVGFQEKIFLTTLEILEEQCGFKRKDPIPPISNKKYLTIYENVKDDPKIGRSVIGDIERKNANLPTPDPFVQYTLDSFKKEASAITLDRFVYFYGTAIIETIMSSKQT